MRRYAIVVGIILAFVAQPVVAESQWLTLPLTPSLPEAATSGTAPINEIRIWYAVFGLGSAQNVGVSSSQSQLLDRIGCWLK